MNEAGFIKKVHKLLDPAVYRWKIADRFTGGIPDCWYSGPAGELWIEYKYVPGPSQTIRANLSSLQSKWLRARMDEGRNVAVVVGLPGGAVLMTNGNWERKHSMDAAQPITDIISFIHAHTLRPRPDNP